MKKIVNLLVVVVLIICLTACGKQYDPNIDPDLNSVASLTKGATNSNEESESNPVYEIIGNRATDYSFENITGIEFVKYLGIGWNLGNTLDATGGNGKDPVSQETSWGNPEVTRELIKTVASYGFTTIRIPVTWTNFTDSNTYKIDEAFLSRVKQIVDWSLEEGLFVIINTHHECDTWLIPTEANYADTSAQLVEMWKQIGTAFMDYDERLIFEGMNEPRTKDEAEWVGNEETHKIVNKLGLDFVEAVRGLGGYNSSRFLMVPCYAASSDSNVWKKYKMPENDNRVILSVHAYVPYNFALNVKGTSSWDSNNKWDTKDIDSLFLNIHTYLLNRDIPCIIGEMGCMSKNNIDARVANVKYFTTKASFYKIPFIWWDNNSFTSGETFGLIKRNELKCAYPQIMETMFNTWYKSDIKFNK